MGVVEQPGCCSSVCVALCGGQVPAGYPDGGHLLFAGKADEVCMHMHMHMEKADEVRWMAPAHAHACCSLWWPRPRSKPLWVHESVRGVRA